MSSYLKQQNEASNNNQKNKNMDMNITNKTNGKTAGKGMKTP